MSAVITETNHRFPKIDGEYMVNGFLMYDFYGREYMKKIPSFVLNDDDIILSTYPRSGTTFTQRIICGLRYGSEAIAARNFNLFQQFPHLDLNCDHELFTYHGYDLAVEKARPRYIKTHVPLSVMPEKIDGTGKVIFVLRNPRDVLVSLYHFSGNIQTINFDIDFDTFFEMFLEGCVMNGHWFAYHDEWLKFCKNHSETTLIITYEQLLTNFESKVKELASFLNIEVNDDQIANVKKETNVHKMKETTQLSHLKDFVRKGIAGDWKNHFSAEQTKKFDNWVAENKKKYSAELFELIGE